VLPDGEPQNGEKLKSEKQTCRRRGTTKDAKHAKNEKGKKIEGRKMAETANWAGAKRIEVSGFSADPWRTASVSWLVASR
jgi:hypothetical protein